MLRLLPLAFLLLSSSALAADGPPDWFLQRPVGESHDYFSGVGDDAEENKAYAMAVTGALAEVGRETAGLSIKEEVLVAAQAQISQANGQSTETQSISQRLHTSGSWQIAPGVKIVRAQVARDGATGRYRAYVLVEAPRREWRRVPQPRDALWRSALVPGWGQIWKHQSTKGYAILVSEVLLLAGTVTTGLMSNKARSDADATAIAADRSYYSDRADNLFYASMGLAIAAAGVYAYNLLDAYLAERSDVIYQTAQLSPAFSLASSQTQLGLRLAF